MSDVKVTLEELPTPADIARAIKHANGLVALAGQANQPVAMVKVQELQLLAMAASLWLGR